MSMRLEGKDRGIGEGALPRPAGLTPMQRSRLHGFEFTYKSGEYDPERLATKIVSFYQSVQHQMTSEEKKGVAALLGKVFSVENLLNQNDSIEDVEDADSLQALAKDLLNILKGTLDPKSVNIYNDVIGSCQEFIKERSGRVSPTKGILRRSFWEWNSSKTKLKAPPLHKLKEIELRETARNFRQRSGTVKGAEKEALYKEIDAFVSKNIENLSPAALGFISDARRNLEG